MGMDIGLTEEESNQITDLHRATIDSGDFRFQDFLKWVDEGQSALKLACHKAMFPVSPTQYSSAVIDVPAAVVYEATLPLTFKWSKNASATNRNDDDTITICYTDNTIQKIRMLEYSCLERKVTWEVVESEPAAPTFSAVHTLTCSSITHQLGIGQSFIEWTTDFSSDVTYDVIEDAKWKKIDAFLQL